MKKWFVIGCHLLLVACQPKHSPATDSKVTESIEKQPVMAMPTPDSFVGLTLEAGETKAEKADLPHRIIRRDGEAMRVTRDYRPERLNFTIEKGIITQVTNG